jgi:ribosome-associated protein
MSKTTKKKTVKAAKKAVKNKSPKKPVKKAAAKKIVAKKGVTKAGIKKAAAAKKKTKLAGGLIVKDLQKKEAKAPARPKPALVKAIIEGLEERKAKNIAVLDLHKIQNRSFDYFVIADADSSTHVEAIASAVEEEVKKRTGERPYHTEGWQNAEWILLDYINVVVHVFQRPVREFYNIEDLWADAELEKIN